MQHSWPVHTVCGCQSPLVEVVKAFWREAVLVIDSHRLISHFATLSAMSFQFCNLLLEALCCLYGERSCKTPHSGQAKTGHLLHPISLPTWVGHESAAIRVLFVHGLQAIRPAEAVASLSYPMWN